MAKLWVEKNPVSQVFVLYLVRSMDSRPHVHYLQGKLGLNYDDLVAVNEEIPYNWWLVDESCKYILSVLVHKDNKDLLTRPAKQPPGPTHAAVREKKTKETEKERSAVKAQTQRPIKVGALPNGTVAEERYGDVDHQAKMAKVDGMRSVIDKNRVDAIMSQISVMRGLEAKIHKNQPQNQMLLNHQRSQRKQNYQKHHQNKHQNQRMHQSPYRNHQNQHQN